MNRTGAMRKAREFFTEQPDEILRREDIALKFGVSLKGATKVGFKLTREGLAVRLRAGSASVYAGVSNAEPQ